jgi:hypothetical protein
MPLTFELPEGEKMQTYTIDIAGDPVTLPIVAINQQLAISLLMVIDMGIRFGERIGRALALKLGPLKPDIIVGAATLGIPVVIEVSRALSLDQYVIAQKSPKIHLADALVQEVQSVTSSGKQRLMLDRRAVPLLAGRRVAVVDDGDALDRLGSDRLRSPVSVSPGRIYRPSMQFDRRQS